MGNDAPSRELSPLQSLIERLEGASGPDREIDAAIWAALQGVTPYTFVDHGPNSYEHGWTGEPRLPDWLGVSRVTASLDAALALVERVLPGWSVQMSINPRNIGNHARIAGDHLIAEPVGFYHGSKPAPLTVCIALLKAVRAQETLGQRNDGASKPENTDV